MMVVISRQRSFPSRWVGDILALGAGSGLLVFTHLLATVSVNEAGRVPQLMLALAAASLPADVFWLWMVVDCAVVQRESDPAWAGWLVGMLLCWPVAWPYYVLKRRPRWQSIAEQ